MSLVMFVLGCLAVMVGVAMVGFGIPVNEFSFGNTLIVAGTTLATGGLIVVALSTAVRQLQRIVEVLAARGPVLPGRPQETFEAPFEAPSEARMVPAPGRVPFPPKPSMREPVMREERSAEPFPPPLPGEMAGDERPHQSFAPSLRNPEAPPVTVEDEVSLSPRYPNGGASAPDEAGKPARPPPSPTNGGAFASRHEPAMDESWRAPPPPPPHEAPSSYFDNMWPVSKPTRGPAAGPRPEPKPEPSPQESVARMVSPEPEPELESEAASPPRTVAILKSGVVDGMGYTLYVDGSIEAELPQGTLRFASIDELRSHLEKTN